jgi:hypothetical protein
MALAVAPTSFSFRDFSGRTARLSVNMLVDATSATQNLQLNVAGLTTLLQNVSNAHVVPTIGVPAKVAYGTNAPYGLARIKAELIFQTDAGAWHRFQIPAIKTSVLYADLQTVDPSGTDMANLITDFKDVVCDKNGNLMTEFIGGFVVVKKMPRRSNSIILSPKADTPEE